MAEPSEFGQTYIATWLNTNLGFSPSLVAAIKEAYPLGVDGLDTPYGVES